MQNIEQLRGLAGILAHVEGPSRGLDAQIAATLGFDVSFPPEETELPPLSASIDAAVALIKRVRPGWMWRLAECSISTDAWAVPQDRDMFTEHPELDIDQRPPGHPAIALVRALVETLIVTHPDAEDVPW